jgi:hypothetical protein
MVVGHISWPKGGIDPREAALTALEPRVVVLDFEHEPDGHLTPRARRGIWRPHRHGRTRRKLPETIGRGYRGAAAVTNCRVAP